MTPRKPKDQHLQVGRPPAVTPEVLNKLESAFAIGATDREACLFADILEESLYLYQRKNPEYVKRKEMLKEKPLLKARNTVVNSLHDPDHAEWYLERKSKDEFSTRSNLALSGRVEVEESINKIIEILNTEVPEACPHCNKIIGLRDSISKKLSALSEHKDEN
jgi:hypothetical protein